MQAFFKPLAKSLRYMALPNWHDCLDDAVGEFARRKREGFPELLDKARSCSLLHNNLQLDIVTLIPIFTFQGPRSLNPPLLHF